MALSAERYHNNGQFAASVNFESTKNLLEDKQGPMEVNNRFKPQITHTYMPLSTKSYSKASNKNQMYNPSGDDVVLFGEQVKHNSHVPKLNFANKISNKFEAGKYNERVPK